MIHHVARARRKTLDELLEAARARISRLEPANAFAATERGAILIDIRSEVDRERDGIVPGSLHIPRTVLEWRLDPDSRWRNHYAGSPEHQIVLICADGYSSVLAAATLVDLGFPKAADVIGGYAAWQEAGLPTAPAPRDRRYPDELAGMRPPESVDAPRRVQHGRSPDPVGGFDRSVSATSAGDGVR